jgi:hypothetical protein
LPIRDLEFEILCREIRGLAISVFRRRSVVAQSLKVRLRLVGIPFFLVLGHQGHSFVLPSVWTVRQVVLLARTLLRVEARRRLSGRLLSSARRLRRPSMSGLRSVTVRRIFAGASM